MALPAHNLGLALAFFIATFLAQVSEASDTSHNPRGNGMGLVVVSAILFAVAWATVTARSIIRLHSKCFSWDDGLMVVGLLLFSCTSTFACLGAFNGLGAPTATQAQYDTELGRKAFFFTQLFYVASTAPIKVSICYQLIRIFSQKKACKTVLYLIGALATIASATSIIGVITQANPPAAVWTGNGKPRDPAIILNFSYWFTAASILTDVALSATPVLILRTTMMPSKMKGPLVGVFLLGLIPSIATITRIPYLLAYTKDNTLTGLGPLIMCCLLESGLGIIAGSLPVLQKLLLRMRCFQSSTAAPPKRATTWESRPENNIQPLPRPINTDLSSTLSELDGVQESYPLVTLTGTSESQGLNAREVQREPESTRGYQVRGPRGYLVRSPSGYLVQVPDDNRYLTELEQKRHSL